MHRTRRLLRVVFGLPPMRRGERLTLGYGLTGEFGRGLFVALCTEFALVVTTLHFGISDKGHVWLLSSAPFLGMLAAVFATALLSRHRKKTLLFALEIVARLLVMAAALMPGEGGRYVALTALGLACSTVGAPLVSGIYSSNLSPLVRGQAMGRLHAVSTATLALASLGLGAALDRDTALFRPLALVLASVSLGASWMAWRHMPETLMARRRVTGGPLATLAAFARVLTRDRAFLYVEAVWFLIGLSNLWLIPIRVLHLGDEGYSARAILLATTTSIMSAQVLGTFFWGRLLYRLNFAVYRMLIGLIFMAAMYIFFHAAWFPLVCGGAMLWGFGMAGGALSWRLVATFFTRPDQVPLYMSIHVFLAGIRGVVGPLAALWLRDHFSTGLVVWISIATQGLVLVLLLPVVGVMRRRRTN